MSDKRTQWGCNRFDIHSEEKDFCQLASRKIKFKMKDVKRLLSDVAFIVIMDVNDVISKKIKYVKEDDEYFKKNFENFRTLEEKLSEQCELNKETFEDFKVNLSSKFVILKELNEKFVWDEMSMLETNYSALAYVLTKFREKDGSKNSFESCFNKYFLGTYMQDLPDYKQDLTIFQKLVLNYLAESLNEFDNEIIVGVVDTIKGTYGIGKNSEIQAYRELEKTFSSVIKFSGDFSFADSLGVDFLVFDDGIGWVPVQVKTSFINCYRNTKFCNSVCMGKENGRWRMESYEEK
jgi:hypothetical protein